MNRTDREPQSAPHCPWGVCSRRSFLRYAATAAIFSQTAAAQDLLAGKPAPKNIPRALTTLAICKRYDYPTVRRALAAMFDELGDVRKLVKGKFVTVKLNLVNVGEQHVQGLPVAMTVVVHPKVALAAISLFADYGAKQIRIVDQLPYRGADAEAFARYGYDAKEFEQETNGRARFINTRNAGEYKKYELVKVPYGGFLASAWEVNKTYTETDAFVSIGKMKSHVAGGVTMGMKNLIGVPPSSLYGDDLKNEPDEDAVGYRSGTMHTCEQKPFTAVETYTGKSVLGDHGVNIPHFIVELTAAFPIDLVVVDGVSTIQSAEGWWLRSIVSVARPGLLLAGRNPVCVDAVGAAVMGFNPEADHRTPPFVNGFNYLTLARQVGLGDNRLANLEIGGVGLEKAKFQYLPTYQRAS